MVSSTRELRGLAYVSGKSGLVFSYRTFQDERNDRKWSFLRNASDLFYSILESGLNISVICIKE